MERGFRLVRVALAGLLLLPLLAGCATDDRAVIEEAFVATYDVTPAGTMDRYSITVTFGDVIQYIEGDGRVYNGYAVEVDYGQRSERLCSGQSVLDAQFQLRRYKWGNGWDGAGRCTHEQFDWVARGMPWSPTQHFGVGLHGGRYPQALTEQGVFEFDGKLAPLQQVKDGEVVARRVSYESRGPLVPLSSPAPPSLSLLNSAARPAGGPTPSGFPGGDEELPHGFTLDDAVAYLRANSAAADAMLAEGACLRAFHLTGPFETTPPPIPLWTAPQTETNLRIELADTERSAVFALDFGPTTPSGERGFFGARQDGGTGFGTFECPPTRRTIPLDEQFRLIEDQVPGIPRFVYGIWQTAPEESSPWFQLVADTDRGRVEVHGTAGLLQTWHVARGTSIDP